MKIATNVHRDAFGGITISNLALFDWLEGGEDTIVGIEYMVTRRSQGAIIFRRYEPSFFSHHIITALDILERYPWEKVWGPRQLRKRWNTLVESTKEVLRKEAPDVVLINGTYFAPWILTQAAEELGIPIVLRYAGVLQQEISHKPFLTRQRLLVYERSIAASADEIIFPSTLCREVVEKTIMGEKIDYGTVIPNPVNPGVWAAHRSRGRYTIAAVGRWTSIKNFPAFTAFHNELLRTRWPHRAILVTSRRAPDSDMPETIERKDSMSHEELLKFYRSIDLLVVPSYFETFCNVAAEAVVLGTTVLVSEHVGFSEILRKAGLGRMVIPSFDDPAVVARAVRRLAKTRVTKAERDAVAALLDPQRVHDGILKVLKRVIVGE